MATFANDHPMVAAVLLPLHYVSVHDQTFQISILVDQGKHRNQS